ncbi:uncharacterized protein TNCV_1652771 [Trichonephila clavipes]|nr:uncharacterized protein TNCV_1652771 [Trichonephila clavipes]
MVREVTGTPSEGATCAWMVADEAVGCARAFIQIQKNISKFLYENVNTNEEKLGPSFSHPFWVEYGIATKTSNKLKLSGATAHEGRGLLCPSQNTLLLDVEVHEQMSQSGGQSEARLPVFKFPSKLGTHLSAHYSRDERLCRPCPARE